jgi:hypothetical protein
MDRSSPPRRDKLIEAMVLGTAIAFQSLVALVMFDGAEALHVLIEVGGEISWPQRLFLATHRWWGLVPLASIAAGVDLLRRPAPSRNHRVDVIGGALAAAVALHWLLLYGALVPFFDIFAHMNRR